MTENPAGQPVQPADPDQDDHIRQLQYYRAAIGRCKSIAHGFQELAAESAELGRKFRELTVMPYSDPGDDPDYEQTRPSVLAVMGQDNRIYLEQLDRMTVHLHGHHGAWTNEARKLTDDLAKKD